MNYKDPIASLFPGAGGRIVEALVHHRRTAAWIHKADLLSIARHARVSESQTEAVLFRLGMLGLVEPRMRGEPVEMVDTNIVWSVLDDLGCLGWRVMQETRAMASRYLAPQPQFLALHGPVAEGRAETSADDLRLVIVPPVPAPSGWRAQLARLSSELSRSIGNVVSIVEVPDRDAARAVTGPDPVLVWPEPL